MKMQNGFYKLDLDKDVNIYTCTDGRMRTYIKATHDVISYPRLLMAVHLGRDLKDDEEIHHLDEDPMNNDIDNLMVLTKEEHLALHADEKRIQFKDKVMVCPMCGKEFVWTAKQQRKFRENNSSRKTDAGPFCSQRCCGIYGKLIQEGKINKSPNQHD